MTRKGGKVVTIRSPRAPPAPIDLAIAVPGR
jgi:hypothetical protein